MLTLNQRVAGSHPASPTIFPKKSNRLVIRQSAPLRTLTKYMQKMRIQIDGPCLGLNPSLSAISHISANVFNRVVMKAFSTPNPTQAQ